MAFIKPTQAQRQLDFSQQMKMIKDNPMQAARAPNKEIIEHEQKRHIEAHLMKIARDMRKDEKSEEEIQEKLTSLRS
jgi:predicted N-formylglutamate amidohydrolase